MSRCSARRCGIICRRSNARLGKTSLPLNLHVADRNAARAAYLGPITDSLKPIFDAINGRARDGNTRLDMPESYAAVFKRCSHW